MSIKNFLLVVEVASYVRGRWFDLRTLQTSYVCNAHII
jgi:hypothetical protein